MIKTKYFNYPFKEFTSAISKSLYEWLTYQHSLTNKLIALTGESNLIILQHSWIYPTWWHKFALNLPSNKQIVERNILMYSKNIPCWYAKTIIPRNTYIKHKLFFQRLQHESLGELIFNESTVVRKKFFYYVINPNCLEYYWLKDYITLKPNTNLWTRASLFCKLSEPFYLIEIFLPQFIQLCDTKNT